MPKQQIQYRKTKCLGCKRCESYIGRPPEEVAGKVAGPEEILAAKACPSKAFLLTGTLYTPRQLMDEILRDRDFYGTRGGVTFSGGEPMGQPEFLEELLILCREHNIHTAIDTCGYAEEAIYKRLISQCRMVLFDIKGIDPEKHRLYTGADNACILKNFQITAESGIPIWVRVPLIRTFNAGEDDIRETAEFLLPYRDSIQQVTLIPYHSFGNTKYATLGLIPEKFDDIEDETLHLYENYFMQQGFVVRR